ncbi:MAG: YifB family Mg chelatase-like AAA ATPase [Eggerthellaceae bacterium]|nr:YifB family Mg chelatase-like AAA ATPase [Eggerthellaceae bacterium]
MYGRCMVRSAVLRGVEAIPVDVEVAVTSGTVGFFVVGMVDAAVQEARERVRAALKVAGFSMPARRILVNLAPSALRKTGSGFDLAIAMGVLVATGQIDRELVRDALVVGELSLDGGVRPVAGLLAYALCARDIGLALVCSHEADGLVPVEDLRMRGLRCIGDLREPVFAPVEMHPPIEEGDGPDFCEVSGNEVAKRALQIAAAGSHGLLMMGPPGSGKTMLASRVPSIMPPLESDEMLEVALVHSVAGESIAPVLAGRRPFRSPHHSASSAGLIGGGSPVRPGEVCLAHQGVLFLDELPEFKPSVLQQIRQPLEDGRVRISRADGTVCFPSRFMLVAAANPCPCGFYGDPEKQCTCSAKQVRDYQNRIGGPLLDRIDLHIDVRRVPPGYVLSVQGGTSSSALREGVLAGREYASWRKSQEQGGATSQQAIASCLLSDDDAAFFEDMARSNHMSGRAIVRTASVARTIADMAQSRAVTRENLCEALGFRIRDGVGG